MKKMVKLTLVILVIGVFSVFCFPAKPLNERSTELAWQAWLLVDDQNQNRQNDPPGGARRRITPKSVFIAPTFSPDTLPACAEGYRSDSMGRCIKIIKLDEDAHLDFLLQKLNEKFGDADYEDEMEEAMPTPGPFQFNIPLDGNLKNEEQQEEEEAADVAIVVAPSSVSSNHDNDSLKIDVKRNNQTQTSGNTVSVETIAHILGVRQEDVETTTIHESPTDTTTTTFSNQESNTASTHFTDGTTTYTETTVQENGGPFYLNPTTESQTYSTNSERDFMMNDQDFTQLTTITTLNTDVTHQSTEDATTFDASTQRITTTVSDHENHNNSNEHNLKTKELVKFPEDIESEGSSSDYVKFPESLIHQDNLDNHHQFYDSSEQVHNVRDTNKQTQELFRSESILGYVPEDSETLRHNQRHLSYFPDTTEPVRHGEHHLDYDFDSVEYLRHSGSHIDRFPDSGESLRHSDRNFFQRQYPVREGDHSESSSRHSARHIGSLPHHHSYNHRNRDRRNDLFILPPSIRDVSLSSQQKPIVLRFTKKRGYLDMDSLKSPQFYRELPRGELSSLFGFRSKQYSHR